MVPPASKNPRCVSEMSSSFGRMLLHSGSPKGLEYHRRVESSKAFVWKDWDLISWNHFWGSIHARLWEAWIELFKTGLLRGKPPQVWSSRGLTPPIEFSSSKSWTGYCWRLICQNLFLTTPSRLDWLTLSGVLDGRDLRVICWLI